MKTKRFKKGDLVEYFGEKCRIVRADHIGGSRPRMDYEVERLSDGVSWDVTDQERLKPWKEPNKKPAPKPEEPKMLFRFWNWVFTNRGGRFLASDEIWCTSWAKAASRANEIYGSCKIELLVDNRKPMMDSGY